MTCKPEIILNGPNFNVSQCAGCKRIGLYYKNLLVGFNPDEFTRFGQLFSEIDFKLSACPFPDGLDHVVVKTCHNDIQFSFTEKEFDEFRDILQKALIILKANEIIRVK